MGLIRDAYIGSLLKAVVHVPLDDTGFADVLTAQEHDFDFGLARHRADGMVHFDLYY